MRFAEFLKKLFAPSDTASCETCGETYLKTAMVREPAYGWFCNEEHKETYLGWLLW